MKMAKNLMVNFLKIIFMDMENIISLVVIDMKEIGNMEKNLVLEF